MIRTQVQLTEEEYRGLKDLARERNVSIAELVRSAVDQLLADAGGVTSDEKRQRAIAATGRFRSGLTDLSTEHDRYLAEAFD